MIVPDKELRVKVNEDHITMSIFDTDSPKANILFAGGVGIKQSFYFSFIDFIRNNGYRVFTFDYRSIGKSRNRDIRKYDVKLSDWAEDIQSAINHVRDEYDGKFIYLAHSFGGQIFGMLDAQPEKSIFICSQNGYYKYYKSPRKFYLMWRFLSPLLYSILNYFPGMRLGMGQDLCKASIKQWKGWCLQKNYLMDDEELNIKNYGEYTGKIISYAITDDEWGGINAVDSVTSWYENADTVRIKYIQPIMVLKK